MNLSNTIIGAIRTAVPLGVGWLITQLALLGVALPVETETQLATAFTAIAAAAYWAIVTALSKKWAWVGWLLGNPAQPVYSDPIEVDVEITDDMTREQYRNAARLD